MESLDTAAWLVDDLLDFEADEEEQPIKKEEDEEDEDDNKTNNNNKTFSSYSLPLDSKHTKEQALPDILDPHKENPFFPVSSLLNPYIVFFLLFSLNPYSEPS